MAEIFDKYGVKERQGELLALMKRIHTLFESEGIKYSLCCGTALGAIRHKGFIPWDDDIDIMVDRENYKKIIELFNEAKSGLAIKRVLWIYRIQDTEDLEKTSSVPTVDIFVADNCPKSNILRKIKVSTLKILQGMMKKQVNYKSFSLFMRFCLLVTGFLGKFFTDNFKFKMYDKVSRIGNGKETQYMNCYNDTFAALSLKFEKSVMDNFVLKEFEDTEFPVTAEYDSYLTSQYGDYMTPPREEERISTHM